jgi:hypothetical protein
MFTSSTFPVSTWNWFINAALFPLALSVGTEDDVLQAGYIVIFDVGWNVTSSSDWNPI